MAGEVTHFEIYGKEPQTLADFYRDLFGWRIERAEGVDYWRIQFDPTAGGSLGGGLLHRPPSIACGWMFYVNVASVDETMATAESLGATVVRPKAAVPRTAWYAILADPEGNPFSVWERDPAAFPPPVPD